MHRFLFDVLLARKSVISNAVYSFLRTSYRICLEPIVGKTSESQLIFDAGNWHGNDSAWRMVSDLMKIVLYADKEGRLQTKPQRKVFSIIDGLIGGENNGPLEPDEKKSGVVIAGSNPLAVDIVATRLMGFDWQKLRWINNHKLIDSNLIQFH